MRAAVWTWMVGYGLLMGCSNQTVKPPPAEATPAPQTLRILHINDHHSRLAADDGQVLQVEGKELEVVLGGFPRVVSAFAQLHASEIPTLKLHAGDAITGDLYFTLFQGEADADLMNQICFDAFEVGNHEFDAGDTGLKRFLDFLSKPVWHCDTPVLGANVHPEVGVSPLSRFAADDYLKPSVVIERGGLRVGIVGVDVAGKTKASSSPDASTQFEDERSAAQREIDALQARGIDHIVLMSHIGYRNDLKLVEQLHGVDAVVGGDSHTLLGSQFTSLGLAPAGEYPTLARNADGDVTCIVQAWQYTWVVGQLDIEFDTDGRVLNCAGTPHLLLGGLVEAGAPAVHAALAQHPYVLQVEPDAKAQHVLSVYEKQVQSFAAEVVGVVPERLCLRRIPGRHDRSRDAAPGCAEATDAQGGHAQAVVARAFLELGKRFGGADIAIQNAGGVRNGIAAGEFSIGDAYLALPYKNMLDRLRMSGAEIHQVLEDAIAAYLADPGAASGSFPYAAGLRWNLDLNAAPGERFSKLEVFRDGTWQALQADQIYLLITNDYIASGQDGFTTFGRIEEARREPTYLHYAQALADYVRDGGNMARPAPANMSTQAFVERQR